MEAKPGANFSHSKERYTQAGEGGKELGERAVIKASWFIQNLLCLPFTIEHLHLYTAFEIVTFPGDQSRTNLIDIPSDKRCSPIMAISRQDLGAAQTVLDSLP